MSDDVTLELEAAGRAPTIAAPQDFAAESGLHGPWLADLLSAFLAHERATAQLCRSAAAAAREEAWRSHYLELGQRADSHLRVLGGLVERLNGHPLYRSALARLEEMAGAKALEVALHGDTVADPETADLAFLGAVRQAEEKARAHWDVLRKLGDQLAASPVRDAVRDAVSRVVRHEDDDVTWARTTWTQEVLRRVKVC